MDEYNRGITYSLEDVVPNINLVHIRNYINTREALYYKDDVLLENPTLNGFQLVSTAPDSPKNTPVIKYLTDSPIFVLYNPFYGLHGASMPKNTMVKLDNILWSLTSDDVRKRVHLLPLEHPIKTLQDTHFLIDPRTQKIHKKAFVEVAETRSNRETLEEIKQYYDTTKYRFKLSISTIDEFLFTLFPSWPGTFIGGRAFHGGEEHLFITQEELKQVLHLCKANEVNSYSKFCERPYEYLVTIVLHIPWCQQCVVTTLQRDLLYESFKLATSYLYRHLRRVKTIHFNVSVMEKMLHISLECPGFTPKQRRVILRSSKLNCPRELTHTIMDIELATQEEYND